MSYGLANILLSNMWIPVFGNDFRHAPNERNNDARNALRYHAFIRFSRFSLDFV